MSRLERLAPLALALAATCASAHGLDALEGTAVVRAGRVEVGLEVEPGTEQAALAQLALHDDAGRAVTGRITAIEPAATPGHVMLHLEFKLSRPQHWLSFRMVPGEWSPSRARRLSLSVRDEGNGEPRLVTLTNGGNVETLRFGAQAPESECGVTALDRPADLTSGVLALWRPDERGARLDIVVPLGVLESWLPISRHDPDAIDAGEQQAARAGVLDVVTARVRLATSEGDTVASTSGEVAFLGFDDDALATGSEPRRLDAWTARVRVSLRFDRPGTLVWELWNARVTTAHVIVLDGRGCAERRLSTYDPKL